MSNVTELFQTGINVGKDEQGRFCDVFHSGYLTGVITNVDDNEAGFCIEDGEDHRMFEVMPIRTLTEMMIQWILLNDPDFLATFTERGDWVAKKTDLNPWSTTTETKE